MQPQDKFSPLENVTPLEQARHDGDRSWNEKKKERTRSQLVEAGVRLVAARGLDKVTINDIATEVAMAPGTFYNYFPTLDAMFAELSQIVVDSLEQAIEARQRARDPGARIAIIVRHQLRRAREDVQLAGLLRQFADRPASGIRDKLVSCVEDDILDGIDKGQFTAADDEAAADMVIGALLAGVARVAEVEVGVDYDRHLTANILRGLGMVSAAALERAQRGLQ